LVRLLVTWLSCPQVTPQNTVAPTVFVLPYSADFTVSKHCTLSRVTGCHALLHWRDVTMSHQEPTDASRIFR